MSGVVPASATEVFRNKRRERSSGVLTDRHLGSSIIRIIIPPEGRRIKDKERPTKQARIS